MSCHRHSYAGPHSSGPDAAATEGAGGPFAHEGSSCFAHALARPPVKVAAVVAGFLISPPLGLAALAWAILSSRRGPCGSWRREWRQEWRAQGAYGRWSRSGNSAFEEKRRATLEKLAEEERAFAEFRRREKESRDREIFERFESERAAQAPKPATDEGPADTH